MYIVCIRIEIHSAQNFTLHETFPRMNLPGDKKDHPHSLSGVFYHSHGDEVKFQRIPKSVIDGIDAKLKDGVPSRKVFQQMPVPSADSTTKPPNQAYISNRKRKQLC